MADQNVTPPPMTEPSVQGGGQKGHFYEGSASNEHSDSIWDEFQELGKKWPYFDSFVVALGVFGVIVPISLWALDRKRKAEEEQKKRIRHISWEELHVAVENLTHRLHVFQPEVMFAFDSRGGLFADLLADGFAAKPPVVVGQRVPAEVNTTNSEFLDEEYEKITTSRWQLYIPKSLAKLNESKIVLVDDYSLSGDTMYSAKEKLINTFGFQAKNVRTLTIVTTERARVEGRSPDWSRIEVGADVIIQLPYMGQQ